MVQIKIRAAALAFYRLMISLRFAVVILLLLAGSLGTATFIESSQGTRAVQYWIYQASWFHLLLGVLGLEIFMVALSRWPWKRRHIPFLIAHLGILILLAGSFATSRYGMNGVLKVRQGAANNQVESDSFAISMREGNQNNPEEYPLPWLPQGVALGSVLLRNRPITVDRLFAAAEKTTEYLANPQAPAPALQLKLIGGPVALADNYWLWLGEPSARVVSLGTARLILGEVNVQGMPGPWAAFQPRENGKVELITKSSSDRIARVLLQQNQISGHAISLDWKGGMMLKVVNWIPHAERRINFHEAAETTSQNQPAVHLSIAQKEDFWLEFGIPKSVLLDGKKVEMQLGMKKQELPFFVKLNEFKTSYYPGSHIPSGYSSDVEILEKPSPRTPARVGSKLLSGSMTVSMNEPINYGSFNFYQSNFVNHYGETSSIFSVNYDPGRFWKYLGAFLIVLGIILLFGGKAIQQSYLRKSKASPKA